MYYSKIESLLTSVRIMQFGCMLSAGAICGTGKVGTQVHQGMTKWFYVTWRRLRKCIIDLWKLAMEVAKFSASFCHQK